MNNVEKREKIYARVKEHYDYLRFKGYEVVCTCLQGSQNYGLDEYSEEYMSDVDTKSIILPSLDDFINAVPPKSETIVLPNNEHAEIKDIRVMFEMFKKMNISYIELLYSDYVVINPAWEDYIQILFSQRDSIAAHNRNQFLRCIAGMAMEKRKALCHPYPSIIDKVMKYGYDGKQLSHCARLAEFIGKYVGGVPLEGCYKSAQRELLMNFKKQKDADGRPLDVKTAIKYCDSYCDIIQSVKNVFVTKEDKIYPVAAEILKYVQSAILKEHMKRSLENER